MRIRPFLQQDIKLLLSWLPSEQDAFEMWAAGCYSFPPSEEQLQPDLGRLRFTLTQSDGEPIGHFQLRDIDYTHSSARIGFIIVDPARRGQGYGRQLLQLAAQYAFGPLGLRSLTLGVFEQNAAARHCYESVGFVDEGEYPPMGGHKIYKMRMDSK